LKIVELVSLTSDEEQGSEFNHPCVRELLSIVSNFQLRINPVRKGNGVLPLRNSVVSELAKKGWIKEHRLSLELMRAKPLDAFKQWESDQKRIGFEWETGNISSSFRALMKLFKSAIENEIDIGVLVLPSRNLYQYLTDRIGNIEELRPYLKTFRRIGVPSGRAIAIIVVEHDAEDSNIALIPKGLDGMSAQRRKNARIEE
jgi:hypothetical protein